MRFSAIVSTGFAASALAKPLAHEHLHKRAYVTDVKWVTVYVYVTAGQEVAAPTPSADAQAIRPSNHYGVGGPRPHISTTTSSIYVTPSSTPVYVAPSSSAAPVQSSPAAVSTPAYTPPAVSTPAYTPPASSAAPVSSAAPIASQVQSSAAPAATGYQAVVLRHHNLHRANHSADDLTWNQTLADAAYAWASQCKFEHHVEGYGQNLAASIPNANVSAQLSDGWYGGELGYFAPYYGIANPQVSEETFEKYGHFTQMVWKGSQTLGCATYDCRGASGDFKMWYTVCNYYPPGNYAGEYANNVGQPLGHPTCSWDA